ncbi:ketosteroid isomerase [Kribbella antibiotica]|uniref:Ketosteroid isomerase n=1 Tax=Kribbella antibiotica TaxID=190195 RepID=A0A4R4ZMR8_9ACTN|nr:nuclear transport factor 2 family protein [Kribbella antibiotica]TDD60151.1 ketosteroid isomerase [Kribbella antibiotica]
MTPEEVFRKLVHGVAAGQYAGLPELYAEQTDVRHPMHPERPEPLRSRAELRAHFGGGQDAEPDPLVRFEAVDIVVHRTEDPEVVVGEFAYAGTVAGSDESFHVPCVFVLRVRDGQIVESRDYVDHAAMAKARRRIAEITREPAAGDDAS